MADNKRECSFSSGLLSVQLQTRCQVDTELLDPFKGCVIVRGEKKQVEINTYVFAETVLLTNYFAQLSPFGVAVFVVY